MKLMTFLFVALFSANTAVAERAPVTVFAAASLRGALDAIVQTYDATVQLSYGGSGTMARQIAAGAPADVVVLAHTKWMDWLEDNAAIVSGTRRNIVANELVLIGPISDDLLTATPDLFALLGRDARLAMGQRDAVPAGIYAREWLQNTGQWDAVVNRLAETDNVRAALALVARGQAPVGIVYASDALADPAVQILAYVPNTMHSPIVYPAAALTVEGQAFLKHLASATSQGIFQTHGFKPVPE